MRSLYPAVVAALVIGCSTSGGRRSDAGAGVLVPEDAAGEVSIGFPDPDTGPDIAVPDAQEPPDVEEDAADVADDGSELDGLDDAGEGDAPEDVLEPLTDITGGVLVLQVDNSQIKVGSVSARFQQGLPAETPPVAVEGPCQVLLYDGEEPAEPAPGLDGGTITVGGLKVPMVMAPMKQGDSWEYHSGLDEDNETILGSLPKVTVIADGGAHVPGWTAEVQVPAPVSVASPSSSADKDEDINVLWNPAGAQSTRLDLFVYDGGDGEQKKGHVISCNLPGDTGSYTVPASLVGKLPGGGSGPFNFDYLIVGVSRLNVTEVPLPDEQGTVSVVVSRSGGNAVQLED